MKKIIDRKLDEIDRRIKVTALVKMSRTLASFPVKVSRSADEREPPRLTNNESVAESNTVYRMEDRNLLDGNRIREKRGEKTWLAV